MWGGAWSCTVKPHVVEVCPEVNARNVVDDGQYTLRKEEEKKPVMMIVRGSAQDTKHAKRNSTLRGHTTVQSTIHQCRTTSTRLEHGKGEFLMNECDGEEPKTVSRAPRMFRVNHTESKGACLTPDLASTLNVFR
jgi:hypothetical protein